MLVETSPPNGACTQGHRVQAEFVSQPQQHPQAILNLLHHRGGSRSDSF